MASASVRPTPSLSNLAYFGPSAYVVSMLPVCVVDGSIGTSFGRVESAGSPGCTGPLPSQPCARRLLQSAGNTKGGRKVRPRQVIYRNAILPVGLGVSG